MLRGWQRNDGGKLTRYRKEDVYLERLRLDDLHT